MRPIIGAICSLIVGLQVLVGVPLIVCFLYFAAAGNGPIGPVAFEMHASPAVTTIPPPAMTIVPPANAIPQPLPAPLDNPILASRAEHGSPLAGTVLGESLAPDDEQQLFVAAFEKVAAEQAETPPATSIAPPPETQSVPESTLPRPENESLREKADQFAIRQLYAMAEMDEQAAEYERADQWRSLAREIRRGNVTRPICLEPECRFSPPSAN
jgi:hypothetical protein